MLVAELFPELAKQIVLDLRGLKRNDLAAQVMNFSVVDRCRCGAAACGTFYTEGTDSRRRMPRRGTAIILDCGAIVTEVGGRIVEIETLDPKVNETLCRVIP
jgi:hypothetical protein